MRTSVFCSLRAAVNVSINNDIELNNRISRLTLAGLEDEGHTVPTLVLNISNQGSEGRAARLLRNSVVFQVAGLAAVQGTTVLTNDDILGLNCIHCAQNTDLLVTDVLRGERDRALHGEQGQNLEKVCRMLANDSSQENMGSCAYGFA